MLTRTSRNGRRFTAALSMAILTCGATAMAEQGAYPGAPVIPKPAAITVNPGSFTVTAATPIRVVGGVGAAEAGFLTAVLDQNTGGTARLDFSGTASTDGILLRVDAAEFQRLGPEGYALDVTREQVRLTAASRAGLFYGVQTLLQLLPPGSLGVSGPPAALELPCVSILDRPRFTYRGMHLDVSRRFFPVWFVKRYIDLLALHKMNVFHWHLTDDNGWRIEIPRYPLLTEISAWRVDRSGTTWREREPQREGETATYGGFYTQEEIREVIAYAAARHVMVIPEIEMPGHTSEVLAAYPELSCTGGPFTVATGSYWPNVDIFCAGNDSVFVFLEHVLQEVMTLFPAPYIHVGGDEADKRRWRACPKCQERIRNEGLRDEAELQSYFIKRIERFVSAAGKRLIGWDEILEGGLPAEATVMSWRGVEGGIEAARQGHHVIMTPVSHCYFDYYQADPEFEPEAIGGHTTLKEVYGFEPVPPELSAEEARRVLGAQGNLWTEYIPSPSHAEYMSLPRMSALAEVVWTPREGRSWEEFRSRLDTHLRRLEALNVNYSRGSFRPRLQTTYDSEKHSLALVVSSEQSDPLIRYTLNGSDPDEGSAEYRGPVALDASTWVAAALFDGEKPAGRVITKEITVHEGLGGLVQYRTPFTERFASDSTFLVDGLKGSLDHSDGYWQAFLRSRVDLEVALPRPTDGDLITVSFLAVAGSRILAPEQVSIEVSPDGVSFAPAGDDGMDITQEEGASRRIEYRFTNGGGVPVSAIRVRAAGPPVCPPGHPLEGMESFLFVDEVIVSR